MNLLLIVIAMVLSFTIALLNRNLAGPSGKSRTTTFWLGLASGICLLVVVISWFFPLFPGWPELPLPPAQGTK